MDTNENKVTSLENWQNRKNWQVARPEKDMYNPPPPKREECRTCHFPLDDASHGWVSGGFDLLTQKTTLIPCPACSGGVEAKRHAQLINDLFGDCHVPFYARDWQFSTYPADADKEALAQVRTFVGANLAEKPYKRGLYLTGDKGNCKTSLAVSALHSVLNKGRSGVFITTIELFDLLRASIGASQRIQSGDRRYNPSTGTDEYYEDKWEASQGAKLLRLVKSVEWLLLDDLGVECGTKYVIQQLYLILEARRSQGLYTIFTSNRDATDLEQYWRSERDGVFQDGMRVIDRLGEYCLTVPVASRNQRMKRGK